MMESTTNNVMNNNMMEPKLIDLYEFLVESELQHYYNSIKSELKITLVTHLKYATDEDFRQIGLSRPEVRRLRKFYDKYYPHGYFSKIKRLLQNPAKKDDGTIMNTTIPSETIKVLNSPNKIPNNKHIIPAEKICVNKELGIGEFGIVQQGVWTNGNDRIQVAIKCLCRERMESNPLEFLKEAAIMHSIEHENIVRLYGVVLDTESLMLVTELAHLRSLLECLKDSGLRVSFLTVPTLCEFAMQICNGMMYLENKRLIHRDLAARNILVFNKNKVKISDFGLSRALGVGKDYYQTNFNINLKLPIAWCAPECINFLRFTNASDVWAYGVCLWEMFSYGFQPWAALTGHQILEAIDEPNYQRLEQPECCPKEYYQLMLNSWEHDPMKRPKFSEIYSLLPDTKPEQLKTIKECNVAKKDHLLYRQNDIITVLDRSSNSPYWKGVLNSGKTGLFNPVNTVTYLGSLPSSINRDSFSRTAERSSKRKLRTEMISRPQNDFKHTTHVGADGACFGDVAFLSNQQNYNHVPRQIVTPYKPSEDIEQTPLLLPQTPTSPDSLQTASGYFADGISLPTNHSFINSTQNPNGIAFDFLNQSPVTEFNSSNPFALTNENTLLSQQNRSECSGAFANANLEADGFFKKNVKWSEDAQHHGSAAEDDNHEYHEISDEDLLADKAFDLGPSLLDEMAYMLRGMGTNNNNSIEHESKSPDFDNTNKKNEIAELKLNKKSNIGSAIMNSTLTNNKSKKNTGSFKPISTKDEKILNQAINFANEISARSMTDLVSDTPPVAQSPKRKFSFRFPNLSNHGAVGTDKDNNIGNGIASNTNIISNTNRIRNFTEEINNVPDLQNSITEECREAYDSLVQKSNETNVRYDYEKFKLEHLNEKVSATAAAAFTLPRKLVAHTAMDSGGAVTETMLKFNNVNDTEKNKEIELDNKQNDTIDSNPLRILRDKNYPIVRPRLKVSSINGEMTVNNHNNNNDKDNIIDGSNNDKNQQSCGSPSYLTNEEYTFNERDVNLYRGGSQKNIGQRDMEKINIVPLPPRDRKKTMPINVKRHIRKHPLIIPASGLQRTLNKVTETVDDNNKNFNSSVKTPMNSDVVASSFNTPTVPIKKCNENNYNTKQTTKSVAEISKLKGISDHLYINQDDINVSQSNYIKNYAKDFSGTLFSRNYENLDVSQYHKNNYIEIDDDTASLNFESILESEKTDEMSSPDVIDGFMFEIQKENNNKQQQQQQILLDNICTDQHNLDIERKKLEFSKKYPNYQQPKNELADNVLFNKIKETVESQDKNLSTNNSVVSGCNNSSHGHTRNNNIHSVIKQESVLSSQYSSEITDATNLNKDIIELSESNSLIKDSNSVSCEDLLEFSDNKPKGRERGIESDEVRIMLKVLGKDVSPEKCMIALEAIDWDVHKAIKLVKLQNALNTCNLTYDECVEVLFRYDWDLQTTVQKLNGY